MLEIKNIYKSFGEQKVLQGLNMYIEEGKIYTMVGGNGTGKTTLFNLITGFLQPNKGEIWYNNKRLDNHLQNMEHRNIRHLPKKHISNK